MSNSVTFVWTCDRCGREQPGDYDPHAAEQEYPVQWTLLTGRTEGQTQREDLCRECSEALARWLYKPEAVSA